MSEQIAAPRPRRAARGSTGGRPDLRVVPQPAPSRRPGLLLALAVLLLVAAVFGAVTANAMAADAGAEARALEAELAEARARHSELVAREASLEDPARIERVARELGMVRAERPRLLPVERLLPADGLGAARRIDAGDVADPLKPLLGTSDR